MLQDNDNEFLGLLHFLGMIDDARCNPTSRSAGIGLHMLVFRSLCIYGVLHAHPSGHSCIIMSADLRSEESETTLFGD